jgi:adenosylcobinamide kinase/adenosylcobinamide-phosphate guanylyltransferase
MAEANPSPITLVLGGARSGKSGFAQGLAERSPGPVLFVATAAVCDEEMAARIAAHRAARPQQWDTLEAERDIAAAVRAHGATARTVLLDCLSLLVSNLLLASAEPDPRVVAEVEAQAIHELESLVNVIHETAARLIVVSNEVGMSVVPPTPLGRAYRDVLGRANQHMASTANEVYLLVAGIPVAVKRPDRETGGTPWLR